MKKITQSLILCLLLIPITTLGSNNIFTDIDDTHPHFIAIGYLKHKEVIGGYPDGSFGPEKTINRAELVKMIIEGSGIETDAGTNSGFPDVNENEWFAKYITKAKQIGAISGYPDGTFKPAKAVNKAEALKIVLELMASENIPESSEKSDYYDVNPNNWYNKYVVYAKNKNVLFEEGGRLNIGKNAVRSAIAEYIYRMMIINEYESEFFNPDEIQVIVRSTDEDSSYELSIDKNKISDFAYEDTVNDPDAIITETLKRINEEREKNETHLLKLNAKLMEIAKIHLEDMVENDFFSHTGSDDSLLTDRVEKVGYIFQTIGENVALGQKQATEAVKDWMESSKHRSNILDPDFSETGIWFGENSKDEIVWVQVFGSPK